MPTDWSVDEVRHIVADYFSMLVKELRDIPYSKAEQRRSLLTLLNGRSEGSIEFKHQNISAILLELGYPAIDGYKPARNYQGLLKEIVSDRILRDQAVTNAVRQSLEQLAEPPLVADYLSRLEDAPRLDESSTVIKQPDPPGTHRQPSVNYLELEARRADIGKSGEVFVVNFERERLLKADRSKLADRIEHVSLTEGDGAGFDIRSFELNGTDRFIEVKATTYGKHTPFFVTRNEVRFSRYEEKRFHLYRVFHLRRDPRLYAVAGAIEERFRLEGSLFEAKPR